ncbi:MAG: metallophosphoesterase [Albidovulum sp.]|nr:metallophosphoesterase [Albidovulum sp.]
MADIRLHASEWKPLDTGLAEGCRICAIGDVHGYSGHLRALIAKFERDSLGAEEKKLILLGDLIDRGPDSLGAIDAALGRGNRDFTSELCLMGNHEQMLKLALRGTDKSDVRLWLYNGGKSLTDQFNLGKRLNFLNETQFADSLRNSLSPRRIEFLDNLRPHKFEGNLLFVHAGIHPRRTLAEHLSQPWDLLSEFHWAWIREPFLSLAVPFANTKVVHGHTFVRSRKPAIEASQLFEPHLECEGKINLDAGSYLSGCVAGAEFESCRYRVTIAVGA